MLFGQINVKLFELYREIQGVPKITVKAGTVDGVQRIILKNQLGMVGFFSNLHKYVFFFKVMLVM